MVSCRLPIGVSPTFTPSTHTSAHGTAFSAMVPFGNSIRIGVTRPGPTCTVRVDTVAERVVDDLEIVAAGGDHQPIALAGAEQPLVLEDLDIQRAR